MLRADDIRIVGGEGFVSRTAGERSASSGIGGVIFRFVGEKDRGMTPLAKEG